MGGGDYKLNSRSLFFHNIFYSKSSSSETTVSEGLKGYIF